VLNLVWSGLVKQKLILMKNSKFLGTAKVTSVPCSEKDTVLYNVGWKQNFSLSKFR